MTRPSPDTLPNVFCPELIRRTAAELPYAQARALWLVDVCGLSYARAATATKTDAVAVAAQVAAGRVAIRAACLAPTGR